MIQFCLSALGLVLTLSLLSQAKLCNDPKPMCIIPEQDEMLFVQDPKNCSNYFQCLEGPNEYAIALGPFSCPRGLEFMEEMGQTGFNPPCDMVSDCSVKCNCARGCSEDGELIPKQGSCTHYFRCEEKNDGGFHKIKETCPEDHPYFNGVECDYTEQYCCPSAS